MASRPAGPSTAVPVAPATWPERVPPWARALGPSGRLSAFDLAELAMDVGPDPRSIGAVLELEGPALGVAAVREAVGARLHLVARLSQRVHRGAPLTGRPVWQDVVVDLDHHVRARTASAEDLSRLATSILSEPLATTGRCGR